jgi:hypothetical protein
MFTSTIKKKVKSKRQKCVHPEIPAQWQAAVRAAVVAVAVLSKMMKQMQKSSQCWYCCSQHPYGGQSPSCGEEQAAFAFACPPCQTRFPLI